ncbi:MAG: type II secretion system protein [Huintestinicola sp.]
MIHSNKMKAAGKTLKAFTLLEMVVVVAIISIMCAIIVPNMISYRRDAKIQAANSTAQQIFDATQDYLISLETSGKKISDNFQMSGSKAYLFVNQKDGQFKVLSESGSEINDDKLIKSAKKVKGNISGDLNGYWMVVIYPETYTVKYAVYSETSQSAVQTVGNPANPKLYKEVFGNTTQSQSAAAVANTDFKYTGQYPVSSDIVVAP